MLRVRSAVPLDGRRLRLTLTDGTVVERDIQDLLWGPVFERLRSDDAIFSRVRARAGTVTWPGNLDIAPETLIWDGPDPAEGSRRPESILRPRSPSRSTTRHQLLEAEATALAVEAQHVTRPRPRPRR